MPKVHEQATPTRDFSDYRVPISKVGEARASVTVSELQPTADQVLAKLLTVDGAGSGLNADMLDGMTPAQIVALVSRGLMPAQVLALIADPAEEGNTDAWPAAKLPAASLTERGAVELATPAEVIAGTDAERAATAAGVQAVRALLAALTGATFTGPVKGVAPVVAADFATKAYVDSVASAGTAVLVTDDFYLGTSDDAIPIAAELTVGAPNGVGTIVAYLGSKHQLIARLASEVDITSVIQSSDPTSQNQKIGFVKYANTVIPPGETQPFNVWVSFHALTQTSDVTLTVV